MDNQYFMLETVLAFAEWMDKNATKIGENRWQWRGDNWMVIHSTYAMFGHFIKVHPEHKAKTMEEYEAIRKEAAR